MNKKNLGFKFVSFKATSVFNFCWYFRFGKLSLKNELFRFESFARCLSILGCEKKEKNRQECFIHYG